MFRVRLGVEIGPQLVLDLLPDAMSVKDRARAGIFTRYAKVFEYDDSVLGPIIECCIATGPTPALRMSSIASGGSRLRMPTNSARPGHRRVSGALDPRASGAHSTYPSMVGGLFPRRAISESVSPRSAAFRSEAVREPEEVFLVDRVQQNCRANEISPIRVKTVLHHEVDVAKIDVAEIDGDLFGVTRPNSCGSFSDRFRAVLYRAPRHIGTCTKRSFAEFLAACSICSCFERSQKRGVSIRDPARPCPVRSPVESRMQFLERTPSTSGHPRRLRRPS